MNKIWLMQAAAMVLVLSLLAQSGCVKVADSAPKAPAGNLPPVISSMTAGQTQTYPGGEVNLQSVVSDPNGDMLNYKWTATGGQFVENGRGNTTWRAPKDFGSYEIKLTVDDGKGGTAQATTAIAVSANHPPMITSLTASPASLPYGALTTLTCTASDQDGDAVNYRWEARDGTLSGEGNRVSWTSPLKGGSYSIFAIVSDGKGAETRQEIVIPVAAPTGSQTFKLVAQESGTTSSTGDKERGMFKAGDDENNIGYRAFYSFNIFPLMGMDIKQARLKFIGQKVVGDDPFDPVTGLGVFQLWHFSWPIGTIPAFNVEGGGPLERAETFRNKVIEEVDVTPELVNDVENRLERFQVEARFQKTTNGNKAAQFIQWTDAVLEVSASAK